MRSQSSLHRRRRAVFRGWAALCLALLWFGCRPATAITIPAVVQTFNAATIQLSGTSTLTLSITNSNASALTTVGFTDTFPAGLVVAATPALTNSCNGSVSGATSGGATV